MEKNKKMDLKTKIVILVAVLLVLGFMLFDYFKKKAETEAVEQVQNLFLKSLETGKGATNYIYSYKEYLNGYLTSTEIKNNGNISSITIESPLTSRTFYFLGNETVVCVRMLNETCAFADNESDDFIKSTMGLLFKDENIKRFINDNRILIKKGALKINPVIKESNSNGRGCLLIDFVIDYSTLSLNELTQIGVGINDPTFFNASYCIDKNSAEPYEKSFIYEYRGRKRKTHFVLLNSDFKWNGEVARPNVILSNQSLYFVLQQEADFQRDFVNCYNLDGKEKDSCVQTAAHGLRDSRLCSFADSKKDRCLLSFIALEKNPELCIGISSSELREDCYIELAGNVKNQSFCGKISGEDKKEACLNVSKR